MKKWIALMLSLILALTLTACGAEKTVGEPEAKPESGEVQADVPAPAAPTDAQESTAPADVWGVTLTAKDVTSTGLTLIISHSGDAPGGMLDTGSPYWVERWQDGAWVSLDDGAERMWTMEAWLIPMNGSREDEVNWVNLYGQLPAGQYRLGKEIMLFRGPGDYEERTCCAEFKIE